MTVSQPVNMVGLTGPTLLKSSVQAVTERGQAVATLQSWSCRPLSTGEALEEGGLAP